MLRKSHRTVFALLIACFLIGALALTGCNSAKTQPTPTSQLAVTPQSTQTTTQSAPTPIVYTSPATTITLTVGYTAGRSLRTPYFHVVLNDPRATGYVYLLENGRVVSQTFISAHDAGECELSLPQPLPPDNFTVTAIYKQMDSMGLPTDIGDISASVTMKGASTLISPTITLTSSANPSTHDQSVTFTVTISPNDATGEVCLVFDRSVSECAMLTSGTATLPTSFSETGQFSITAIYSGDANFNSSTSPPITQTVTGPPPPAPSAP